MARLNDREAIEKARRAKDNFCTWASTLGIRNSDGSRPQIIASRPVRTNRQWIRYLRRTKSELLTKD